VVLPELIDTQDALDAALERLGEHRVLALDTETDSFFAYRPAIRLLQFSIPGEDLVVDPMADLDLEGIGRLLADPEREVVLHAAENDVIMMQHQFRWRIARLFDTQVACFVLGLPPYSLAGVLEERFGVKLDKSLQRSDWSQRPLTPEQVEYAACDTRHLIDLAAELHERAEREGRVEEIEHECARIATREWEPTPFDPEDFRKIKGARDLDPTTQRVLRDLYVFRHHKADQRNRAPYRIIGDHGLMALARRKRLDGEPPKGVPGGFWRRYARDIRRVVQKARERGPLPSRKKRGGGDRPEPMPAAVKKRYERLRKWRAKAAKERGVESFVVARNELLQEVARAAPGDLDALAEVVEPFRLREYGEAMLAALLDSGEDAPHNRNP